MKILVVGGAGYIGSHFVLEASKRGNEITVFDDLSSGFKSNLNDNISFYKGSTLSKKEIAHWNVILNVTFWGVVIDFLKKSELGFFFFGSIFNG